MESNSEKYSDKYGELISLNTAAQILDRDASCLRVCLYRQEPFWTNLAATKVKIGRRIHFKTNDFFSVVLGEVCD